jgi:hypothetical protein
MAVNDETGEDREPTEEEVLALLQGVAGRISDVVSGGDPRVRDAALEVLATDDGARALLGAAFEEGRQDAVRSMLLRGGKVIEPDWSDVESPGERRLLQREESICSRCTHGGVCVVTRGAPAELLLVVSRCAGFVDSGA